MKAYIYCDLTNRQAAVLVDAHGRVIQSDPSVDFNGEVLGFLHSDGPEAAMDWIAWHPELCDDLIEAYDIPGDVAVGPAKYAEYSDAPAIELPETGNTVSSALMDAAGMGQPQHDPEDLLPADTSEPEFEPEEDGTDEPPLEDPLFDEEE